MKSFSISYDAKTQCLSFHIHQSISVDDILIYFSIARKQRYLYYHNRLIKLNDLVITQSKNCQNNDIVAIDCRQAIVEPLPFWERGIDICYEDDICLIVNKPSGILVHSDGVNQNHTLHNMVQAYYHKRQIHAPIRAIHRLDKDTSGLLFYCKLPFFQAYFDKLLQDKQITRRYLAWCTGNINSAMIINKSIARDRHHADKMRVSDNGAYAETHIEPLALHANCTLVECRLKTGRTHQIRVHLAAIKHPLLSDPLYGFPHPKAQRLALHAWKLQFYHPLKAKNISVSCPLPDDFPFLTISKKAVEKL